MSKSSIGVTGVTGVTTPRVTPGQILVSLVSSPYRGRHQRHQRHQTDTIPFRDDVQCHVERLTYDFAKRAGVLELPEMNCTSMSGCIRMFTQIDQDVEIIQTVVGGRLNTQYRKEDGKWKANLPHKVA